MAIDYSKILDQLSQDGNSLKVVMDSFGKMSFASGEDKSKVTALNNQINSPEVSRTKTPAEELQEQLVAKAKELGLSVPDLERTMKEQQVNSVAAVNSDHVNKQKEKDQKEIQDATKNAFAGIAAAGVTIAKGSPSAGLYTYGAIAGEDKSKGIS